MQEEFLPKKAIKVLSIINRSFSDTDAATIAMKNKLIDALVKPVLLLRMWRHSGRMVSALVFGLSGLGSCPGLVHCVVFLGKTLYSHGASLHPGV